MRSIVRARKALFTVALLTCVGPTAHAADCSVSASEQQCCSRAKCGGEVLSNRDAHNCKVKSNGKSWHAAAVDGAPAACVRM